MLTTCFAKAKPNVFGCASDVNICYREGHWQLGLHLINVLSQVWQSVFPVFAEIPENFADPVDHGGLSHLAQVALLRI